MVGETRDATQNRSVGVGKRLRFKYRQEVQVTDARPKHDSSKHLADDGRLVELAQNELENLVQKIEIC